MRQKSLWGFICNFGPTCMWISAMTLYNLLSGNLLNLCSTKYLNNTETYGWLAQWPLEDFLAKRDTRCDSVLVPHYMWTIETYCEGDLMCSSTCRVTSVLYDMLMSLPLSNWAVLENQHRPHGTLEDDPKQKAAEKRMRRSPVIYSWQW